MLQEVEEALESTERAQPDWAGRIVRKRLQIIGKIPQQIIDRHRELLSAIRRPNASEAEKVASELLPLADACRYAAKSGRQILAPRSFSILSGAWWMGRIGVSTVRDPWGTVLIIAPSNYPLFIPGVQLVQALAAGNAVLVKPAAGNEEVLQVFKQCLVAAGVPKDLFQVLPATIEVGQEAIRRGVDKIILTGSIQTGKSVLREAAETVTPATLELSGCDAVFILPQADVGQAARAVAYALCLNGGATCIAPRRIFLTAETKEKFCKSLLQEFQTNGRDDFEISPAEITKTKRAVKHALADGASLLTGTWPLDAGASRLQPIVIQGVRPEMEIAQVDLFAPVTAIIQVADISTALESNRACPYILGVSIFGPRTYAEHWASRIDAGCVVINDVIVPTGDPRVSFGGRGHSGYGITRGPAGLLEMTRPKTICTRHGKWLPHLDKESAADVGMLLDLLALFHGRSIQSRFGALRSIIRRARGRRD